MTGSLTGVIGELLLVSSHNEGLPILEPPLQTVNRKPVHPLGSVG